jgi:exonuclease VII small subunit
MKSKHIPDDIKSKTLEEAQNELQSIMSELEADNALLESSMDKYTRMLQLNYYILQKFKKKISEINQLSTNKKGKVILKDIK